MNTIWVQDIRRKCLSALFLLSEETEFCKHYPFIYLLQHVLAICISHHQVRITITNTEKCTEVEALFCVYSDNNNRFCLKSTTG
jgi:hypothetical protein